METAGTFMMTIGFVLLCVASYLLHLAGKKERKTLNSSYELRQKEKSTKLPIPAQTQQPQIIREVIVEKPVIIVQPAPPRPFPPALTSGKIFVSVVFKGSLKHYDYLLNPNENIQVGDYVEVWAHNPQNKNELRKTVAQVRYISYPGEFSQYARSEIVKKATAYEWRMAS
ncbi:MAG: hypothetical protein IKI76_06100 [Selenomonadaceae bacterium]|nr:hypothetical protein [Selenomonadaceae bacterium]